MGTVTKDAHRGLESLGGGILGQAFMVEVKKRKNSRSFVSMLDRLFLGATVCLVGAIMRPPALQAAGPALPSVPLAVLLSQAVPLAVS